MGQFQAITSEITSLKEQRRQVEEQYKCNTAARKRIDAAENLLEKSSPKLIAWNESVIRQLVDTVKVLSANQIAYTGPRAPSARSISPTLPERSPTIPRAVLEERPCQPRRRAEPGISDRSRGWGCRWQSKQSPVIECDSGKSVIPPAWHRRFPRIPVPLHAGSSNPIQGHRGNRRD